MWLVVDVKLVGAGSCRVFLAIGDKSFSAIPPLLYTFL
jgi:hypothetical protein